VPALGDHLAVSIAPDTLGRTAQKDAPMYGLPPVASAITRETMPGFAGALFAMLLFLAGQREIAVDRRPGPLAWTAFPLAVGPALLLTARSPFGRWRAAGVALGIALGHHPASPF
jgi:hypothetical protein